MGELKEARRQLDALPRVLKEDYQLMLIFHTDLTEAKDTIFPKLVDLIEQAFGIPDKLPKIVSHQWTQGHSATNGPHKLLLGFTAPEAGSEKEDDCVDVLTEDSNDDENKNTLQGLVVGPESNRIAEAKRFRVVWAGGDEIKQKKLCQLRRFQDGTIKETVNIEVSSGGGHANDFVLDKIVHLISVNFATIEVKICRGFTLSSPYYKLVSESYLAGKRNEKIRKTIHGFVGLITECTTGVLPIRKATVACSCLHNGDKAHHLQHKATHIPNHFWLNKDTSANNSVKMDTGHQIAEKSKSLPNKCRPITILLDITLKRSFSSELFQRLAQTHLIQLSRLLNSQRTLKSILYNGELVVEYEGTLFGISVQQPSQTNVDASNMNNKAAYQEACVEALHERIRNVSNRHSCWWGAERLVHHWIATSYLQSAFPEIIADLLLAVILDGSFETSSDMDSDHTLLTDLLPPASLESAFIRFLYHLSFADFATTLYFLDKKECRSDQTMKKRKELPPIAIITPFDQSVSGFTKGLSDARALRRIINCAQCSLQNILKMAANGSMYNFDELFKELPKLCLQTYDAIIFLKPLVDFNQYDANPNNAKATSFTSLAGFDIVQTLLSELESAFQMEDNVMFHYNPEAHNIGLRLPRNSQNGDIADLQTLMEDIMIIGKGFIKDVRPLRSDDNLISIEQ